MTLFQVTLSMINIDNCDVELVQDFTENDVQAKLGSQVIFYHVETNSLLAVSQKEDNPEAPKILTLTKTLSDSSIFSLRQSKESSIDTDEIFYDQAIEIVSEKFKLYLKLGPLQTEKIHLNPQNSYTRTTADFPKIMERRNPEMFLGTQHTAAFDEVSSEFKLTRYQSNEDVRQTKERISTGDYIRIRHIDKWLTFYPNQDKKKEVYFEKVNNTFQRHNFIHTIFQVVEENSLQCNPIALNTSKNYILKHFVTGNYLHYDAPNGLKMYADIRKTENESPYCNFETESEAENPNAREKLPLRIKYPNKQETNCYVLPTDAIPVKNMQFEINTLYFFGFRIPEEYSYKNQKNLTRYLGELSSAFEQEGFNIVLEKVRADEMEQIIELEQFANELQALIDLISVPNDQKKPLFGEANKRIRNLLTTCQTVLERMYKKGKLLDEEEKEQAIAGKYQLEISNRQIQALIREFRVFDLIHFINFLFIKKSPKNIEGEAGSEIFNLEDFFELYGLFSKILLSSLNENIANRFYNSQYIRIYIHFMSADSCEGVFKKDDAQSLLPKMRRITLRLLKVLLWDDDLDGLGQLNFYQTMIFTTITLNKTFETTFLELLEHISSSKAYNLINSFRDSFITQIAATFKSVFPIISLQKENIYVEFHRNGEKVLEVLLEELSSEQEAYSYFIVSLRVIVALSTSKLVTFYHQFIKNYPLNILNAVLKHPTINVEIKMLVHLIILYVYFDYIRLPFNFIPPNIQTSNDELRHVLNQEEKKIVNFCKTCIGDFEKNLLVQENINEEVNNNINNLNTQDCSQQIQLLELFIASEISYQSARVMLFYINSSIHNGNGTIHFLNKAKEALIKVRKMYQNSKDKELEIIPELLELFSIVNQKMKIHSTIAIYNQVIKNQNPNAEVYSRQIISGLKKIYLESFSPIEMIALNEPIISSLSLKYLKDVANYENSIADELDKFVVLSSMKDVEILMETIDIALTLNQSTRKYYVQKEKEGKITMSGEEYVQNISLLEKLFTFIYNPADHFLFSEEKPSGSDSASDTENPVTRFFRVLRQQKVAYRDHPFLLQPKAVLKLQQRIFALLSLQDFLLKLLNCTIILVVENKPAEAPAEVYQARLILMILIAFVYKNKSNQNLLAKSHGFISLYYLQKYIDKSCDTLTLFAEVMRDNEELLEISKKFIYDITCYTFLGTIKPRAIVKDSGAYLCTAIMSMHFLHKADLPVITYDTFTIAETKFDDIFKNDFPNLNLLKKIQEKVGQATIDLPACYYNIRQMFEAMIQIVDTAGKEKKSAKIKKFRDNFNSKKFFQSLTKPDFCFQFELKSLLLKCLSKLNFSKHHFNHNFFKSEEMYLAQKFVSYLLNDLFAFLLFSQNNSNKEATEKAFLAFTQETEKYEETSDAGDAEDSMLKEVRKNYLELKNHDLYQIKQIIFLDEVSIPVIWEYLYIFDSCWKVLAKIFVKYPDVIKSIELFEFFLLLSEQLTPLTDIRSFRVLKKMKKYFILLEDLKQYESVKEKIKDIKESIIGRQEILAQDKDLYEHKKQDKVLEEPPEKIILENIIDHMRGNKQKDMKANIEMFAQLVKTHSAKRNILSELLVAIESNPLNLHKDVITLVARLLKGYIVKTLPENPEIQNESAYEEFYKVQNELTELHAEKSLMEGICVVQNIENIEDIFKLALVYAAGFNIKTIEKMKKSLNDAKFKLIWSDKKETKYEANVGFILQEIKKSIETLNDPELTKFLDYCIRSSKELSNEASDENKQQVHLTKESKAETLIKQMQSFFQEYANKDQDEVYKELGPLLVTMETLEELFRVRSTDTASLKIAKNTILKSIRERDLENAIINYFLKKESQDKDSLELIKIESILLLDIFVSKIKFGMLSSE